MELLPPSMKLRVVLIPYELPQSLAVVSPDTAARLELRANDRAKISWNGRTVTAFVAVAPGFPEGAVGLYVNVARALGAEEGSEVHVEACEPPVSAKAIRRKLAGARLAPEEIHQLVRDIVEGRLSEVELTALVTSLHFTGMSLEEAKAFTVAMVETGTRLVLNRKPVLDKHSLGGVPGDKTSLLIVPIIASLGYTIPKTSSRAITSPAGTADRMEVLAPVNLSLEEMKRVVEKANGCIVWGGNLNLAPADDIIIRVEYPLGIDPFFVPSILAKKLAVGSTHMVLDIPTGRGTKAPTLEDATRVSRDFLELGSALGLSIEAVATYAEEPIGYAVGPALEAREALEALSTLKPGDLVEKAAAIAGILLEMVGVEQGYEAALRALSSRKAEMKLREIIELQGGDPGVKPSDVPVGDKTLTIYSEDEGLVQYVDNAAIALLGKLAGAPSDKGAGVLLHVKIGQHVRKGDPLMTIYSSSSARIQAVEKSIADGFPVFRVSRTVGRRMLLERYPSAPQRIGLER
ncbi:MAG: AMP phosphorylase [Thermofilum sp.]|uniref:AMP phosphorylase n=1 Tax=Thermofilum pendens TaxID=2269 RepID=A0A7C4D2I8_THEPE